jgi:hypothetical protein
MALGGAPARPVAEQRCAEDVPLFGISPTGLVFRPIEFDVNQLDRKPEAQDPNLQRTQEPFVELMEVTRFGVASIRR